MRLSVFFFLFNFLFIGSAMANIEKTVYGYVEKATLVDKDLSLSAKMDTGAKSASLNALNIREVSIDNKTYLKFIVPSKEGDIEFTSEYIGEVKIKARNGEKPVNGLLRKPLKRPVVRMTIRLDNKERDIRVNLTNRKHFIYPLLLGREAIIAFGGIIDPSQKFTINTLKSEK